MIEAREDTDQPRNKIERGNNSVTITRPEGKYSIAYSGTHLLERKPVIPAGIDGICFEYGSKYPTSDNEFRQIGLRDQRPFFEYAALNKLPLLATDCAIDLLGFVENAVEGVKFLTALKLFKKMRREVVKRPVSRRTVLKSMLAGGAVVYLESPLATEIVRAASSLTAVGEEQTVGLSKLIQETHPEYGIVILKLRDTVAAQKMYFLLLRKGYRHLIAPRGALHVGLETAILSSPEDRMAFLRRFRPVLPKLLSDVGTFYKISEYRISDQAEWEFSKQFEEPTLKQLAGF